MGRLFPPPNPVSFRFTKATTKMSGLVFGIAMIAMSVAASAQEPDGGGGKVGESKPDKRAIDRGANKLATEQLEPLARYVPNDAGIYFRISDHEKWRALLGRIGAFAELPDPEIQALLVGQPRVIALQSWRQRGREMIAVCRPNDAAAFARALEIKSAELVREDGKVKVYHSARGLWIATNGEVFVLSDIGSGSAMFEQSARMLAGHERASLLDGSTGFRFVVRPAPPGRGRQAAPIPPGSAAPSANRLRPDPFGTGSGPLHAPRPAQHSGTAVSAGPPRRPIAASAAQYYCGLGPAGGHGVDRRVRRSLPAPRPAFVLPPIGPHRGNLRFARHHAAFGTGPTGDVVHARRRAIR
jgi:hypothetical protein